MFLVGGLGSNSFREGIIKLRKDNDKQYYPNNEFWYVHHNGDRAGSVIAKMIFAHSYAYYNDLTFRGLCHTYENRINQVNSCLDGLHLTPLFNASSCPKNYNKTSPSSSTGINYNHPNILNKTTILDYRYITPDWLADINRQRQRHQILSQQQEHSITINTNNNAQNNNSKNITNLNLTSSESDSTSLITTEKSALSSSTTYHVAVHVRRGDVSPCTERYKYTRYLPNKYFLEILDQYIDNYNKNNKNNNMNIDVTIYSESETVEPFDDFNHRGYNVELDTDLAVVWKKIASADIFISSTSQFSIVPALFSTGLVVLPPIGFAQLSKEVRNRFPHFLSTRWSKEKINTIITKETDRLAAKFC